jgi:UDP-3-O-[3-hydroxymyristoyl] glucosamine N-acyltransferase
MLASELARRVEGHLEGADREVHGVATLEAAGPEQISFLSSPRYQTQMAATRAGVVIVSRDYAGPLPSGATLLRTESPYAALRLLLEHLYPESIVPPVAGIHPSAVIGEGVACAEGVSIGALVVVEHGVQIGPGTGIGAGAFVGAGVQIGSDCRIHPGVVIYPRCRLGNRVEVLANAVIGSDGFGHSREQGHYRKLPHVGIVVLEDDVLVGAGTTIDRSTFGETRIGAGTRLDNLIMIAHNCTIGPDTAVAAQVGFAGSTHVGAGVQIGGQAGFAGHLTVHDRAVVGAQAGVTGDVPAETFVSGYPARPHKQSQAQLAALARLPELRRRVRALEKRLAEIDDTNR